MKLTNFVVVFACLLGTASISHAELIVNVGPPEITGQKAVVPLTIKNNFAESVESARAVVFILDEQGKMVSQATRWIIGGNQGMAGLSPQATNIFYFVITNTKPFTTTNLTARVSFTRVIMEGGKLAEIGNEVKIQQTKR